MANTFTGWKLDHTLTVRQQSTVSNMAGRTVGWTFAQIRILQERQALTNVLLETRHVVAVLLRVVRNQSEASSTMPILLPIRRVMEIIGFFEKVVGGGKLYFDDTVASFATMGNSPLVVQQ